MKKVINKWVVPAFAFLLVLLVIIVIGLTFLKGLAVVSLENSMKKEGVGGAYNAATGLFMCNYEGGCLHEVGHWLDFDLDSPSQSKEFKKELDQIIEWCKEKDRSFNPYCSLKDFPGISGNPPEKWGGYEEAYAEVYRIFKEHNYTFNTLRVFFTPEWND